MYQMNFDRNNTEHAHKRIDMHERRIQSLEDWQTDKDQRMKTIVTYVKAGVFLIAAQTMGVVELIKTFFAK